MITRTVTEFRRHFYAVLKFAQQRGPVHITRRGKIIGTFTAANDSKAGLARRLAAAKKLYDTPCPDFPDPRE